ncbi:MAG: hypothetical protein WBC33_01350 [Conexibacter sp.]
MRSISSRRPSAGLVVAIVALFVALGGTSYAAVKISGVTIQKGTIPANRVVPNALTGKQIDEAKLGAVPLASKALSADNATAAQSAQSATSAQDAQALQGRDATKFLANSVRVTSNQATVVTGASETVTVSCAANEKGIAGGAAWIIPGGDLTTELDAQLNASLPVPATGGTNNMTGWRATGINRTGFDRLLRAYVVCVPATA